MNQDKIWDYYQNEDENSFVGSEARLSYLIKKFRKGDKVLNIGVGGMIFEKLALEYGLDIYSLDPSENSIEVLKELIGKEKAKVGYSQSIDFEDSYFDGVVMSEVLEHLTSDVIEQTLNEVKRVLKDKGRFVGSVPYKESLREQIVMCPNCGVKFHRWGHIQSFDESKMFNLLKKLFLDVKTNKKMFITWQTLNYKGKVSTVLGYVFYLINVKNSGLNLCFEGVK